MSAVEYLESERIKIWGKISELQELIDKKTSDYEREAQQASKKCSEFKNKCELTKNEAGRLLATVEKITADIQKTDVNALITEIQSVHDKLIPKKDVIHEQIAELESLFNNFPEYSGNIRKLDSIYASADETSTKIEVAFKQVVGKKKEIEQLHMEIFGYTSTDSDSGNSIDVTGLKAELEEAYSKLKTDFEMFSSEKNKKFDETLQEWETNYSHTHKKIESLLPNALTTGLSFAYSAKKDAELKESAELEKVFKTYVKGLILISCIPFAISIYLLFQQVSLDETILKMPRLVLSILPLYIPVLWVAYSANRKMNLSKRLIEEYTHKEVLSKTFEGLAQQIQNIEDSAISADLKTRLLYNILEVSSENPGKLISNYDKSDHPLMDALDKSVRLSNTIERLKNVPGMSKLINVLDDKAAKMRENQVEKAIHGLDSVVHK